MSDTAPPVPAQTMPSQAVYIVYTNYRGETAIRVVIPRAIAFGATAWHPEPQWLLHAFDVEKAAERSFAMKDLRVWIGPWVP